jgi:SLT domain-containing protein
MARTGRAPIKIGSGYIEINTALSQESVRRFRTELTKQMEKTGAEAGAGFSEAVAASLAELPKTAAAAAKKAAAAVEGEAKDSAETIAKIEADLTKQFGTEAAKRFREARELEEQKQTLTEETSSVTQAALKLAVRQETAAAQVRSRASVTAEKAKQAAIAATAKADARSRAQALEDEARIDREIEYTRLRLEQETQAQIRETLRTRQQEHRTFLQTQLSETQAVRDALRDQLAALRLSLEQVEAAQTSALTTFRTRLKSFSEDTEKFGIAATEAGTLITHKIIAPLSLAAGAATDWGVRSADAMIQAQTGLHGMHLELKDVTGLLQQMTQYGITTPYSVSDMLTYGTRYARANAAHNKDFNSADPAKHALGSQQVAARSSNMVKMIGDSAAYGGITDPQMVSQGMYALEVIQDMGRVNLRNLKQLERATGIPAENLAQLVGFQDRTYSKDEIAAMKQRDAKNGIKRTLPTEYSASAQLMDFMANAKDTGGVSGDQVIDALLKHWNDPKSGIKGAAARMGSATISGRLENMKENAQYQLGRIFYSQDPKTGKYRYSGLGESIMGKQVHDKTGTHFEGGLLNQLQDVGGNSLPTLKKLVRSFIDGLTTFVGWLKDVSVFLKNHPAITDMIVKAAKFAAVMAPILIGLGTLSKLLGKLGKLGNTLITPVKKGVQGARGASRIVSQARAGVASRRTGGSFRDGYTARRSQIRDTASGGQDSIRRQIGAVETQTRQAEDRIKELQERLKEVNAVKLDRVAAAIAGESAAGTHSVAGAARQARTDVSQVRTEGIEPLDRSTLTRVQSELDGTRTAAEKLIGEVAAAQEQFAALDGKKLTQLKITVDGAHGTVTDLQNKIDDTAHSIVLLDGKSLTKLKREFGQTLDAADQVYAKVGQGTGGSSLAGRIGLLNDRKLTNLKGQFSGVLDTADSLFGKIGQGTGGGSLAGRIGLLNQRSLKGVRDEFGKLLDQADNVYSKVGMGTGADSVAGRIGLLNQRSLTSITGQVNKLGDALGTAEDKAKALDTAIQDIGRGTSLGGKSKEGGEEKPRRPKKLAHGGVLPGYRPGVDTIPAILSPGEAVLRPEVARALGAPTIDYWNAMARRGRIARFAEGGIAGRIGLDKLQAVMRLEDIWPLAKAALTTMTFDASSDAIGGPARTGMLGTGTRAAEWIGENVASRFTGMFNFVSRDSWKLLDKLPTEIGQAIGIVGGTFAPTLSNYFWDDVWKGTGNIVQRGNAFLNDTFSVKTLTSTVKNLFGGVWDTVKSAVGGTKDFVTDPVKTTKDAISALWDVGKAEVDQVIDMVSAVKSMLTSPGDYADSVWSDVWSTAKGAMPNTKGLFDFSSGDKITAKKPDTASAIGTADASTGNEITRWRSDVRFVLKQLGLSAGYTDLVLHRIKVESGGNPNAINNWDGNAKAGHPSQGLMQTIASTFAAYAGPYRQLGVFNPLASIYAGVNYALHRYGSHWPQALAGTKGYWTGTASASPGLALVGERGPELVDFRGGERVYNGRDTAALLNGRTYEIHVHEAKAEDTTQATIRALKYMENLYGI